MNDSNLEKTDAKKNDIADIPKKQTFTFPLVNQCDMVDEMKTETFELCVTACERHSGDNESAAKMIKETMDLKYGLSWHAVVGEGFGLEITHEVKTLLYMYFAGNLAICVWKCI